MQNENQLTDLASSTSQIERVLPIPFSAYETSLLGEYARLLLLLTVMPLLVWFSNFALGDQTGVLCLVASLVLLTTLVTSRGYQPLRITLLVVMFANVLAFAINPNENYAEGQVGPPEVSVVLLLSCIGLASVFEIVAWSKSNSRIVLLKTLAWGLLLIPALIYVLVIPIIESAWVTLEGDSRKLALRDPNWSVVNEATYRLAKLSVFWVFAYLGACLGSFLNVVAYCVPRGKPIGVRDSCCPQCNATINRIDNLPVFSYINLGAKCRNCQNRIPARYLIVELVVLGIFGALFLYELVTGCANVPMMNVHHKGILWVILYPKWPAIAIYFFHCLFMSAVFVLALIEWDRQPLTRTFTIFVGTAFLAAAALYLPIQPVPVLEHTPQSSIELSPWLGQLLKLAVGGVIGAIIGRITSYFLPTADRSILTFAFFLTGVVVGWQALLQVAVVFWALSFALNGLATTKTLIDGRPTMILFIAITMHHPFWKTIANCWRFD
ncbi:MAG: prepilin peptidase [Planctomycetota bacterium]